MLRKSLINDYPFYLCALLFIAIFLSMRLSFFLYDPAVSVAGDSASYVELAEKIRSGVVPQFTIRSPGYPLFIWLCTSLFKRWLAVIAAQHVLSLTSSLCLIYGVYRLRRGLTLPATLAMAGFTGGTQTLYYDSYVLSESLYTSCIVFTFAFALLAFASRRALHFGIASFFMAAIILVRSAGMYFAVIYILILIYLLWNKYEKKVMARFLIPFPTALLLLCFYNYWTINTFAISAFGEVNLALATISFWEPDPEFPPEVNKALKELPGLLAERVGFTEEDRLTLENSWDAHKLDLIFKKVYSGLFYDYAFGKNFETPQRKGYIANRYLIRKVIFTSIKNHPALYAKFAWTNSIQYFRHLNARFDFYEYQISTTNGYRQLASQPSPSPNIYTVVAREYVDAIDAGKNSTIILENNPLKSLRLALQAWQWNIFQQEVWAWAYFIMFGLSIFCLAASKGRHFGAFILFILTVSVIGSNLTVSLVEISLERYAYPTQFVYYLSAALLPLLWLDDSLTASKSTGSHIMAQE